jgi:hypothetical protein
MARFLKKTARFLTFFDHKSTVNRTRPRAMPPGDFFSFISRTPREKKRVK